MFVKFVARVCRHAVQYLWSFANQIMVAFMSVFRSFIWFAQLSCNKRARYGKGPMYPLVSGRRSPTFAVIILKYCRLYLFDLLKRIFGTVSHNDILILPGMDSYVCYANYALQYFIFYFTCYIC